MVKYLIVRRDKRTRGLYPSSMTNSSAKLRSRRAISSSLRAAQKLSWLDGWASVWVAAGAEVDAFPVGPRVGPEDEIKADVLD